jgi:hypothetical protein
MSHGNRNRNGNGEDLNNQNPNGNGGDMGNNDTQLNWSQKFDNWYIERMAKATMKAKDHPKRTFVLRGLKYIGLGAIAFLGGAVIQGTNDKKKYNKSNKGSDLCLDTNSGCIEDQRYQYDDYEPTQEPVDTSYTEESSQDYQSSNDSEPAANVPFDENN